MFYKKNLNSNNTCSLIIVIGCIYGCLGFFVAFGTEQASKEYRREYLENDFPKECLKGKIKNMNQKEETIVFTGKAVFNTN